jgi:ABC-type transport system involved in multi-copper enzyme maturation permease subunit
MQSIAMLVDSWRLLTSRRLFWITLAINLLVVVAYASVGFTDTGVSVGFGLFAFETERFRVGASMAKTLYLSLFSDFIIDLWLAWIATGLALISTSSIFPDFLGEGAVDMVLSRPIGRVKVFLLKYLGALLFVLLQVGVFCLGAFLAIGWRLDEWKWSIFLAVPIVLVFYSSLYCVNVLVGVLTRSSIAALLATGFFWFVIWCVQTGEQVTLQFRVDREARVEWIGKRVGELEAELAALAAQGKNSDNDNVYERVRGTIEQRRLEGDKARSEGETAQRWHDRFRFAQIVLPKNRETTDLISRWVQQGAEFTTADLVIGRSRPRQREQMDIESFVRAETPKRVEAYYRSRPWWWVLGTGVLFQVAVLTVAAWIFYRRDF